MLRTSPKAFSISARARWVLGKAVMCEGLRRVQGMGAPVAFVSGEGTAANALYRALMDPEYDLYERSMRE